METQGIKKESKKGQPKIGNGSPIVVVGLLVFGGFITIFNEVEMNIALATISSIYDVPVATAQWLTTGYMLVAGALMPLAAFFMGRFGSRKCTLGSLFALLAGILISLFSTTFEMLLVGRLVQAVCAAFFMPVMMAVVMTVAPKDKIGMYNGLVMLVLMAAPAISPTLSGIILSALGLSWLFVIMLPFLAICIVGTYLFMGETLDPRETRVDPISVILSCLGFGGTVYGIGQIAGLGFTSPGVLIPLVIGVASLVFYSRRQLGSETPLLNLRILSNMRYRRSLLFMCALQLVLFGTIIVVPLFLQKAWGLSAMEAGLYMLPGGVLAGIGNLLAGMAYDKVGLKIVPIGLVGIAIGYAGVAYAMATSAGPIVLIVFCTIYSALLPFATTAFSTNSLGSLKKFQLPDGSSMNNTLNQIFGSLGTAIYTIILYQIGAACTTTAGEIPALSTGSVIAMGASAGVAIIALAVFALVRKTMEQARS